MRGNTRADTERAQIAKCHKQLLHCFVCQDELKLDAIENDDVPLLQSAKVCHVLLIPLSVLLLGRLRVDLELFLLSLLLLALILKLRCFVVSLSIGTSVRVRRTRLEVNITAFNALL